VAVLACAALAACGSSGGKSSSASASGSGSAGSGSGSNAADVSGVTLTVGDQAGVGAQAVLTAAGLIDKLPFKVKWADFAAGAAMLQAMGSGSVDVGDVGNGPPVFAAAGGAKLAIVEAQRNSPGFSALLVPKGSSVTSASQLKGQKIGVPQGSSSNYHMLAVLTKAGLGVHDVSVSYLQPPDALAAIASGSVDAVDLWQPYVQQAISQDGAHVLATASGYAGNYSYTVASRNALSDPAKRAAIAAYLKLLNQAYRWAGKHPQAWAKVWAKATGLSTTIMDAAAKNAVYTPVPLTKSVIAAEQGVATAFYSSGLIPKKVNVPDYVYTGLNGSLTGGG
jgi:sulfonate transport system substrate-binding protein